MYNFMYIQHLRSAPGGGSLRVRASTQTNYLVNYIYLPIYRTFRPVDLRGQWPTFGHLRVWIFNLQIILIHEELCM